jgi:hypothetical protein
LLVLSSGILSLFALAGCGSSETGPELFPVTGEVTFEGQPVETGRITFREVEGDRRAFSTEFKGGQYELQTEPGKMTVEITASRPTGKVGAPASPDEEPKPIGEMYIPAKYNSKTELTAEVKPVAEGNDIPFKLTK